MAPYYSDKAETLKDIFGAATVEVGADKILVDGRSYPVIDDVIDVLVESESAPGDFAPDIQRTFSAEWQTFPRILPEHEREFAQYFDVVNPDEWRDSRVVDLGCGIGRWSYFLAPRCREIVLVDFSEAIYVARKNLLQASNAIFIRGDIKALPFRDGFADAIVTLGVLHHLPTPALDEVRNLHRYARDLLVYLYYALDNRPAQYRLMLGPVTATRKMLNRVHSQTARTVITWLVTVLLYEPLILAGSLLSRVGLGHHVPLHDTYAGKGLERVRQDAYDRFFTRIEQRVSRAQIEELSDTFDEVVISEGLPFWHFRCRSPRAMSA